jgi:hypothetical protein
MSQDKQTFDQLPETIVARLRARDRAVSQLTPTTDRAVIEAARAQFAGRPSTLAPERSRTLRSWRYPAAAAAAVALVALLIARPFDNTGVAPQMAPQMANDVDGSGSVDVLDAFALARARAADANAASQARIDELMAEVVALSPSGGVL